MYQTYTYTPYTGTNLDPGDMVRDQKMSVLIESCSSVHYINKDLQSTNYAPRLQSSAEVDGEGRGRVREGKSTRNIP